MSKSIRMLKHSNAGYSLVETMIGILILGTAATMIGTTISFSLNAQREARRELEAARVAGQVLETLRATSFDSLPFVENGGLSMEPLSTFHAEVLRDIEDRMRRDGFSISLTIRPHPRLFEAKAIYLTIASEGVSPSTSLDKAPPMTTLLKTSTVIIRKGLNP